MATSLCHHGIRMVLLIFGLLHSAQRWVQAVRVDAVLIEEESIKKDKTGSQIIYDSIKQKIRLIGHELSDETEVSFTTNEQQRNNSCSDLKRTSAFVASSSEANISVIFKVTLNPLLPGETYYYLCIKQSYTVNSVKMDHWIHQGSDSWLRLKAETYRKTLLPVWIQIILIIVLLCLSGLFSGLNLGLMSLDKTELKIIEQSGSKSEKRFARIIRPVREKGNFLLCTLLLGNVLVNNTLTILMDDLTGSGVFAVISATVGIVVFGEIVPQAICSRHGLAVGARTVWITRLFMVLTFPLSYPVSLILDKILGEEIGQVYNREKLQQLIRLAKDLKCEEVDIISGALALTKKTAKDAMTKMSDVFMLELNTILDFETVSEAMKQGYTRIPVYEKDRENIVAILNIKDLALIDPDDKTPLRAVCKFYNHPVLFVFDDHKLDNMLQDFKQGQSHMAIVRRVNNEGDGDPYYETLGIITMEDVIEELIQSEIIDETDTVLDNRMKKPRHLDRKDLSIFNQPDEANQPHVSPQLTLACFQFLFSSVEPFKEEYVSESVLKRLLKEYVMREICVNQDDDQANYLFREGQPCDFFVLILQGHVNVIVGKEHMVFDGGPFSYYGVEALMNVPRSVISPGSSFGSEVIKQEPYTPDYSVKALTDLQYLLIPRGKYIAARRATLFGQKRESLASQIEAETFKQELNKTKSSHNGHSHALWKPTVEDDGSSFSSNSRRASDGTIHKYNYFSGKCSSGVIAGGSSSSVNVMKEAAVSASSAVASSGAVPMQKSVSSGYISNLKQNLSSHEVKEASGIISSGDVSSSGGGDAHHHHHHHSSNDNNMETRKLLLPNNEEEEEEDCDEGDGCADCDNSTVANPADAVATSTTIHSETDSNNTNQVGGAGGERTPLVV
ncbi:metal transporter CNNM4 [Octopus bimaculoides]|nr:metal transporter CNNM4 [Octopus bimaculoides]